MDSRPCRSGSLFSKIFKHGTTQYRYATLTHVLSDCVVLVDIFLFFIWCWWTYCVQFLVLYDTERQVSNLQSVDTVWHVFRTRLNTVHFHNIRIATNESSEFKSFRSKKLALIYGIKRIQFMLHICKNVFSMFKILFEIQNNTEKIISRVKINEDFF